ncbi:AraC family transcriptional regulator [Azospirillum rugosum]|nr:AraC family transcriptional regulator [Azospirillum rugosum]
MVANDGAERGAADPPTSGAASSVPLAPILKVEILRPELADSVRRAIWTTPGFRVDLVHPQPFRTEGDVRWATIGLPLGPLRGDVAINSDRMGVDQCGAGMANFCPPGTDFRGVFPEVSPYILVGIEPARLNLLQADLFEGRSGLLIPVCGHPMANLTRLQPLLQTCLETGGGPGRLYLESLLTLIAAEVLRDAWSGMPVTVPPRLSLSPSALRRTLDYIESNLSADLTLSELAGVAGLSPYHFARGFRKDMGKPPHRYVMERRLERARHLLATTAMPAVDIAGLCGFASGSHMATVFRNRLGISPRSLRAEKS